MSKPIIFKFILSDGELNAIGSLGNTDEAISLALDEYLHDPANRIEGLLPVSNIDGYATYAPGTTTRYAYFHVPEDLRDSIKWDLDGASHLRAAIRLYLRKMCIPITEGSTTPKPLPPAPKPPVQFAINVSLLERLKALGGTIGGHVAEAVREYYGRNGATFNAYDGYLTDDDKGVKELTWKDVPNDVRGAFPAHEADAAPYIRAAIRYYLSRPRPRKSAQ